VCLCYEGQHRRQANRVHRLKSRHENLYASYHVAISVNSAVLSHAVELFMSPVVWPYGVFFERFFRKRDGSAQQ